MMITGISSAKKPSRPARSRSIQPLRGSVSILSRRQTIAQALASERPISSPGKMPARNSWVMETLAATPNRMKPMEGGMTGAMMPPAAISPAERGMS